MSIARSVRSLRVLGCSIRWKPASTIAAGGVAGTQTTADGKLSRLAAKAETTRGLSRATLLLPKFRGHIRGDLPLTHLLEIKSSMEVNPSTHITPVPL
mmetsp:Transcript_115690/g.327150  ORF Transcript_115690/g.327150 Transcript_115690/m.327150 type:complete len:98 (+) Transcript_115690:1593-1886(+)